MTMRDEVDQLEHRRRIEELRAKKEREEILESVYRKHLKFKARPVPQSTYYPMSSFPIKKSRLSYSSNRLNEDYISRFPLRKTRSEGFSLWDQEPTPAQPFKARDVPLSTYARPIDDEVRSQKRAAEKSERAIRMLKSSRPPSGIMDHAVRSNLIHRIRHEAKCVEKTSKRSRSVSIPDFAAIHEKWDRRMQSAKAHKLPTVTKPFNFVEQGYHEPHCENDAPEKFVRIPIRSSISLGTLAEKVPIRTNTAQLLRNEAIRRKMESFSQSQNASKEFWKERKLESHAMQRKLGKLTRSKGSTSKEIEKTTEEKRHAVAERSEDYRREIEAMKERVARRPLVLERQLILMQKQQVDRVLKSALSEAESSSKAGIPPLPISRRASSGSSKSSSVGTQGTRVISKSKSSPPKDTNGFVDDFESESTTNYENSSSTRGEDHSSSNKETSEAESSEETSDTGSGSSADLSRITEHTEHSD
ncbi:hypothetical protein L596_011195 [Steinernema carpocapsae]|uniref:Uncharacterized protein n=2 Tax=Steinernema carpocapsae TaxID=34508 RepID=A0A4U5NSZ9_STECR|nr:hypothetical protein L596_011195 [Steinernema carpocapsae]